MSKHYYLEEIPAHQLSTYERAAHLVREKGLAGFMLESMLIPDQLPPSADPLAHVALPTALIRFENTDANVLAFNEALRMVRRESDN